MGRRKEITDLMEAQIICVYLVQKMGKPTLDEILETAVAKLNVKMEPQLVRRALEGCSRSNRDFIAILQGQGGKGGQTRNEYCVKDLGRWKSPPEYGLFNDLLPQLLANPANEAMKSWFDEYENAHGMKKKAGAGSSATSAPTEGVDDGDNETVDVKMKKPGAGKKAGGNIVDEYHAYSAKILTLDVLLGSQIAGQYSDFIRSKHPSASDALSVAGVFERDDLTGEYVIPSDVLRGWFMVNAIRYVGLQDARANYVAFSPIRFKPVGEVRGVQVTMHAGEQALVDESGDLRTKALALHPGNQAYQHTMPVNTRMGASAPKTYEAIPAGQVLDLRFSAPTKGFMLPEQVHRILLESGIRPRRGLSPARGCRFGKFMLLEFIDHGPIKDISVDYTLADIPANVMEVYGPQIRQQYAKLKNVRFTNLKDAAFNSNGDPEHGAFPSTTEPLN